MGSPIKDLAARYLESAEGLTPARLPLKPTLKFNENNNGSPSKKQSSPDLEELARQMNIDTPSKTTLLRNKFETPSATVSSFKSTPKSKSGSTSNTENTSKETPYRGSPVKGTSLRSSKGYEYLCRVYSIKKWLENVLLERISQQPVELLTYLQNGIHLAKLANVFLPTKKPVFTKDNQLQFRHTENINTFFRLLDHFKIPDLFRFELTDLYDAKDIPKVWLCLHVMSFKINQLHPSYPPVATEVGEIDFSESDIKAANRALVGRNLPSFDSADGALENSPERASHLNRTIKFDSPPRSAVSPPKASTYGALELDNPFREPPSLNLESPKPDLHQDPSPDLSSRSYDSLTISPESRKSPYYTPELDKHVHNIIKLQALSSGALFRYNMFVDKIVLKSFSTELTELFSVIRGNLSRSKTIHRHRDELLYFKKDIIAVQALSRRKLLKSKRSFRFDDQDDKVRQFQSIIRGSLTRHSFSEIKKDLSDHAEAITSFQSRVRARRMHKLASTTYMNRSSIEPSVVELQSIARRRLYHENTTKSIVTKLVSSDGITSLQSIIRAGQVRNVIRYQLRGLGRSKPIIREFQSLARGAILRTRLCNSVLITLIGEDIKMNELFAKARGDRVRKEAQRKKSVLSDVTKSEIVPLQSMFRGILTRFYRDVDLDDIYEDIDNVVLLQAIARGGIVRRDILHMMDHYNRNVDKVVKAQSILRSKYIQNAYKALINMKNPPVNVVRKFAYLLSDSEHDFQEELELSEIKDKILDLSRSSDELELQIEGLDIKLSLLDKNKITVEDFMKNSHKYKAFKPPSMKASSAKTLEKLNKQSKRRIELYQSMLYLLQTKPVYWIRLFDGLGADERNRLTRSLHSHIFQIFPLQNVIVNSRLREEYFYVKFVCALMENDMKSRCTNIADITKPKSAFWIDYLADFTNQVKQRQYMKGLYGRLVQRVLDEDELTFESDPAKIYQQIREKEERVHGFSDKEPELLAQEAIKIEEVSSTFVDNLLALREFTTDAIEAVRATVRHLPVYIRILAHNAYRLSQINFPEQNEQHHLAVAGVILIKHYVSNVLIFPENYGFMNNKNGVPNADQCLQNLKSLSRVLLQVFSLRPFSDNFLKPMNEYIMSQTDLVKSIIKDSIRVKDLESEYEMNDYDDLVSAERPSLTMKVSDMIALEKLMSRNQEYVAPSVDDQLFAVISELNDLVNSTNDIVTITELGSLTITLTPATKEDSLADAKTRTLFAQAKRCLLYIVRVQDGNDLLELLIQGIKSGHEQKYQEIVAEERESFKQSKSSRKTPYQRSGLTDISRMSYVDLKKLCLKTLLQLESLGQVTRKNSFQELLNQIVVDIKTKDTQRRTRNSQRLIANMTVNKLEEKKKFLEKQLEDYNKHIENILSELQLKPKEKKIFNIIPVFSKQYFYQRELKKTNRLPKFGSYKYSAKKLTEQKVLEDFGGHLQTASASSSKLDFMFSCHKVGTFIIEAARGQVTIPGAHSTITIDQLLDQQYRQKKTWTLFDGMVTFNTDNLAALLFRKFYDLKKE